MKLPKKKKDEGRNKTPLLVEDEESVKKAENTEENVVEEEMFLLRHEGAVYWTPDLENGHLYSSTIDGDGDPYPTQEIVGRLTDSKPVLF